MKIKRISIIEITHKPLLNGLELNFANPVKGFLNANCLIGVNGSGKSQLLETIAEIFLFLDTIYRHIDSEKTITPPLFFEIEYSIKLAKTIYSVEVIVQKKAKIPSFIVKDSKGKKLSIPNNEIQNYLPQKVIGYTSSENETISIPFRAYYDVYATHTGRRAIEGLKKKDYEPSFYFMDYNTNLGIVISNLVFDDNKKGIREIKKELNIESLKSFRIVLQTNQPSAPKIKNPTGEPGIVLTKELKVWRDNLITAATSYDYDNKHKRYILDFHVNDATVNALKYFFKSAYNLYTALYKFELLNNLIIDAATRRGIEAERKKRKLISKMPEVANKDKVLHYAEIKLRLTNKQIIDYLSLSDGEHQFFNIFGTILMVDHDNSLFLLDEPETHFNPKWRRLFISHLNELTKNRLQDLFLTSHSPFIVSDSKREAVYIFERISQDKITVRSPSQETFGASFNHILQMAFNLDEVISQEATNVINKLKDEEDPTKIELALTQLGESASLLPLYRRIELLSQKKK